MPRPELAATHSSHCFASVFFRCRWGGGVFGPRAVGGRELNGFISQNGVRPAVDETFGVCELQVRDLIGETDCTMSKEDVFQMECAMLTTLKFELCRPTPYHFLRWLKPASALAEPHEDFVQYILELALVDSKMLRYLPSHQAAAALLLACKLLQWQRNWQLAAVERLWDGG